MWTNIQWAAQRFLISCSSPHTHTHTHIHTHTHTMGAHTLAHTMFFTLNRPLTTRTVLNHSRRSPESQSNWSTMPFVTLSRTYFKKIRRLDSFVKIDIFVTLKLPSFPLLRNILDVPQSGFAKACTTACKIAQMQSEKPASALLQRLPACFFDSDPLCLIWRCLPRVTFHLASARWDSNRERRGETEREREREREREDRQSSRQEICCCLSGKHPSSVTNTHTFPLFP